MRGLLLLLWLSVATPAMAQTPAPDNRQGVLVKAVEAVIRPAFGAFEARATELQAAMTALCAEPSAAALEEARGGFRAEVLAWSRAEFWRMGPLGEENRAERVLFWPDRKGIALRQMQAILAEQDESAKDPATLSDKSVAVQGLTALEFVLFGTGSEELLTGAGDFRCRYGQAISENLRRIGGELVAAWSAPGGIADHLSRPAPDNDDFRTVTEALEGLVGAMSQGAEAIRDTRLLPFLGAGDDRPSPRAALFWRSQMTVPAIAANFEGIRAMFEESGIVAELGGRDAWISNSTSFEFDNAQRAAADVTLPVAAALQDKEQRDALGYLVILSQSLQKLIGENLSSSLGLSVGFSALDGD